MRCIPRHPRRALPALAATAALLGSAWVAAQDPAPAPLPAPAPAAAAAGPKAVIEAARQALRSGRPEEAARLLKPLDPATLPSEEARSARLHGRDAALRTGDRAWLEAVNDFPDRLAFADGYAILTAWSYLKAADFESTRFYLGKVRDEKHLNEREKRRLLSIRTRLEQLEGNAEAERGHVEEFVEYAGRWSSPTCMGCHENEKRQGEIPLLDVRNWWVGDRYVALLKGAGDAARVREAAESRLKERPTDDAARLRLAYALRALGDEDAATAAFRELDWVDFPDREPLKPRDIFTFP
jgi:hypothetical protein